MSAIEFLFADGGCQALLIGCGAEKRAVQCAARDLYTSPFFAEKRAFAEATGKPWAILSAKMGILQPDVLTRPYEQKIDDYDRYQLREWCAGVSIQLFEWHRYIARLAIIAGADYVEPLTRTLAPLGVEVVNPCAGLGIGQQRQWLRLALTS